MARKIVLSDVARKHLKIVGYLVISAVLAYILSLLVDRPEALYFAPVINYILYAIEKELKKEGFVEAIRKG